MKKELLVFGLSIGLSNRASAYEGTVEPQEATFDEIEFLNGERVGPVEIAKKVTTARVIRALTGLLRFIRSYIALVRGLRTGSESVSRWTRTHSLAGWRQR